jgi:hypothetical protein
MRCPWELMDGGDLVGFWYLLWILGVIQIIAREKDMWVQFTSPHSLNQ